MRRLTISLALALVGACSQGSSTGDGSAAKCSSLSGAWQLGYTCHSRSDGGGSVGGGGGSTAYLTQTDCSIQLVQKDDKTTKTWTSSGTVDQSGKTTLAGELSFAAGATCTGAFDGTTWTSKCTSSDSGCDVTAVRLTR